MGGATIYLEYSTLTVAKPEYLKLRTYSLVSGDGLGLEDECLSVVEVVFKEFLVVLEDVSPVLKAHILDALK